MCLRDNSRRGATHLENLREVTAYSAIRDYCGMLNEGTVPKKNVPANDFERPWFIAHSRVLPNRPAVGGCRDFLRAGYIFAFDFKRSGHHVCALERNSVPAQRHVKNGKHNKLGEKQTRQFVTRYVQGKQCNAVCDMLLLDPRSNHLNDFPSINTTFGAGTMVPSRTTICCPDEAFK